MQALGPNHHPPIPGEVREAGLPLPVWLLGWGVAWLTPFAVFKLALIPRGGGMFGERPWLAGAHFLLAFAAGWLVFRRERDYGARIDGDLPSRPALAVVAALALTAIVYALGQSLWDVPAEVWARYEAKQVGIVRMDLTYLTVKLPELLFQQLLIYALARRLQRAGLTGWRLIAAFCLCFGTIHTPMIALIGWAGVPFCVAAYTISATFPLLICRLRWGIAYSFSAHLLAYVAAGALLRSAAV